MQGYINAAKKALDEPNTYAEEEAPKNTETDPDKSEFPFTVVEKRHKRSGSIEAKEQNKQDRCRSPSNQRAGIYNNGLPGNCLFRRQ